MHAEVQPPLRLLLSIGVARHLAANFANTYPPKLFFCTTPDAQCVSPF